MMKQKEILLLEGDYTQCLPTAKSLHKHGYVVDGVFSDKWSYGYGSRYVRNKYVFKDTGDTKAYYGYIVELLKSHHYDAIIPLNDESATLLAYYREKLLKYTKFMMPDAKHYALGFDKHQLMEVCAEKGFPHPKTLAVHGADINMSEVNKLKFPILIKPNYSSGARGITLIEKPEELEQKFAEVFKEYGECHLQEYIPQGGAQVEVQIFINSQKELVQSSVIHKFRWYPEKGGSSCCNVSEENDKIVDICYQLCKVIGWEGLADFDTIEDPRTGELLIMELNPRLPACTKTSYASGIDWADVIVSEYLGVKHPSYKMNKRVFLRHLGFEALWFYYSKNKFTTKPSWFKFFGRNIFYQDMNGWSDPMPFIRGTWGNLKKQLSPEFRKSKAGTQ